MLYNITFLKQALKEWEKLNPSIRENFKKKLEERRKNPKVQKDALSGMENCYKIKFRALGYRLVYRVIEERIVIQVIAIGKRDKSEVYNIAKNRIIH